MNSNKNWKKKSIFVFLTSKYKGWSHIDKEYFRGLCLTHDRLPVIIINDSDAKKAQSFTLMHELGHLLRGNTTIESWQGNNNAEEKWCNQFAGNVLMPENQLPEVHEEEKLSLIKEHAEKWQVSPYAFLVRLRQTDKITQKWYDDCQSEIKTEYEKIQAVLRNSDGGPSRNRPQEVKNQFGTLFVNSVLTAWQEQHLSLHRVGQILDLKRASHVLDLVK